MSSKNSSLLRFKNIVALTLLISLALATIWLTKTDIFIIKQKEFNNFLMSGIREIKSGISFLKLLYLSLFSIAYGFFHAMGPGHGKLFISGFLIKRKNSYAKAIFITFITTTTHVGTAIIIAYLLKYVFTGITYFGRISMLENFKLVSGTVILLLGFTIIFSSHFKKIIPSFLTSLSLTDNIYFAGIIAGAIPCPLSMMVILISISYSIEFIGLLLVCSIAFGILLFLTLFSLSFIFLKENSSKFGQQLQFKLPFDVHYLQGSFYLLIACIILLS